MVRIISPPRFEQHKQTNKPRQAGRQAGLLLRVLLVKHLILSLSLHPENDAARFLSRRESKRHLHAGMPDDESEVFNDHSKIDFRFWCEI